MSRGTGRKISAALAVGAIGLALVGCGGSSSSTTSKAASSGSSGSTGSSGTTGSGSSGNTGSTASTGAGTSAVQNAQQVNKAVQAYTASTSGVNTKATDPASWDQLSQGAKKAADTINGLTPPAGLQSAQKALASSLTSLSDSAAKVATDLRNKDTSAVQADLAKAKAATQAYATAGAAWTSAAKSSAGG